MRGEGGREMCEDVVPLFVWHGCDWSLGYTATKCFIVELVGRESSV